MVFSLVSTTTTQVRARYAETDAQGIVHHASYLVWFEVARTDFLRRRGVSYRDLESAGWFLVVTHVDVTLRAAVVFDDLVTIDTVLEKCRGRGLVFSYRVTGENGCLLAEGRTRHLVIDKARRPASLPRSITDKMQMDLADNE